MVSSWPNCRGQIFSSRSGLKRQGYRTGITPIEVDSHESRAADH
jgi:hypothetical protein